MARVLYRSEFSTAEGSRCPDGATDADKVIHPHQTGKSAADYGKDLYAEICLRNLTAPHPGDPGQGGRPNIVKGDCLAKTTDLSPGSIGGEAVTEAACAADDTKLHSKPDYRVIDVVPLNLLAGQQQVPCPTETQVEFTVKQSFTGDIYCAAPSRCEHAPRRGPGRPRHPSVFEVDRTDVRRGLHAAGSDQMTRMARGKRLAKTEVRRVQNTVLSEAPCT